MERHKRRVVHQSQRVLESRAVPECYQCRNSGLQALKISEHIIVVKEFAVPEGLLHPGVSIRPLEEALALV